MEKRRKERKGVQGLCKLSGGQTHLSQHCEAGRVQLRLLQLHHPDPAVLIQVFLIVTVAQSQRMHLERRRKIRTRKISTDQIY